MGIDVGINLEVDEKLVDAMIVGALRRREAILVTELADALADWLTRLTDDPEAAKRDVDAAVIAWRATHGKEPELGEALASYLVGLIAHDRAQGEGLRDLEKPHPQNDRIGLVRRKREAEGKAQAEAVREKKRRLTAAKKKGR